MRRRKNLSRLQKFDYVQRDGLSAVQRDGLSAVQRDGLSAVQRDGLSAVQRDGLSAVQRDGLSAVQRDGLSAVQRDELSKSRTESEGTTSTSRSATKTGSLKPYRRQRGKTTLSSTQHWADTRAATTDYSDNETATSLDNLREKCKLLVKYAHIDRIELERDHPDIFEEFMNVVFLGKAIISKPEEYKEYMKVIGEVFAEEDIKERGTVGDFMYGCYKEPSMPGRKGCTPECAGSLPNHASTAKDICDRHVGIYKNKLSLHFSPEGESSNLLDIHAYKSKIKLSHETLEDLSDRGIQKFRIYWQTLNPGSVPEEDVQVYDVKKMQGNISKGGYISYSSDGSERFHQSPSKSKVNNKNKETKVSDVVEWGFGWVIGVVLFIFFIFIIIFAVWYVYSNRTKTVVEDCATTKEIVCPTLAPARPRRESGSRYNKCL